MADGAIRVPEWLMVPLADMVSSPFCCCSHYTDETAKETVVWLSIMNERTRERKNEKCRHLYIAVFFTIWFIFGLVRRRSLARFSGMMDVSNEPKVL